MEKYMGFHLERVKVLPPRSRTGYWRIIKDGKVVDTRLTRAACRRAISRGQVKCS